MSKIIEINIKDNNKIYQELAMILSQHKDEQPGSCLFIIEGTKKNPIIGLRYPGRKLKKRDLNTIKSNSVLWANLYDFEVVPFWDRKELSTQKFTFTELIKDFQKYKIKSEDFWKAIEMVYYKNIIPIKLPKLSGINPLFYLQVLKWIWIQEDFNYRFCWNDEEVNSPIRYVLETRTGSRTSRGAGRAKFFAALLLLKNSFSFEQVKKIIPLY